MLQINYRKGIIFAEKRPNVNTIRSYYIVAERNV